MNKKAVFRSPLVAGKASQAERPISRCSRRGFLKGVGLLAGSSLVTGLARQCHAAERSTIKLALIGCGPRGTGAVADAFAAAAALDLGPIKLFAMADIFEHKIQASYKNLSNAFAAQVDVPPERQFLGFDAYRKAMDCLQPGDIAILTTSSVFRPLHFEYAVQKGLHVFMEKSFAVDAPGTRRLLRAAEESEKKGLKVGCGFMWRHSVARQEVVKRIWDGAIGEVHTLRIYRVHGPVHCPKLPPGANELAFQLQHPVCFNWVTGGFFVDWHCHNVDQACWVKQDMWPVSAQAMGGRCYPEAGNLFDHYCVEYTFADGAKLFAFSRHMNNCWQTYADFAHGSKGSAVIMESLAAPKPRIYKTQRMVPEEVLWQYEKPDCNPYHEEWKVLLSAIRQDKPHNEARRAGLANLATLLGRMAAHTGQLVTWEEAMNSKFEYVSNIDQMTFDTPPPIKAGPDGTYEAPLPGVWKEV
jgi:predicted dehydrogenase